MTKLSYTPLVSAFIQKIEHSHAIWEGKRVSEILTIYFTNGSIIEYQALESVFHEMEAAHSVGKYYHANIKDKFQAKKIR